MPSKNYQEIVNVNSDELKTELEANQLKLTKMKFNHAISPLENTNVIKETRKQIARIQTELRKRALTKQA
jgi:large subunit ribosomal protein L29